MSRYNKKGSPRRYTVEGELSDEDDDESIDTSLVEETQQNSIGKGTKAIYTSKMSQFKDWANTNHPTKMNPENDFTYPINENLIMGRSSIVS